MHYWQMSALCLQDIFGNKLYIFFKYYLLRERRMRTKKRRKMIGGLKVGDSFGSDVTKIKYCALKGILSDLYSHARYVLTIWKIHLRCILWRVIICREAVNFLCQLIANELLKHKNTTHFTTFPFWYTCKFFTLFSIFFCNENSKIFKNNTKS